MNEVVSAGAPRRNACDGQDASLTIAPAITAIHNVSDFG